MAKCTELQLQPVSSRPAFAAKCFGATPRGQRGRQGRAAFGQESAPDWAQGDQDEQALAAPTIRDPEVPQVQEPLAQTALDKIVSDMAVDPAEVVGARVSAGRMNFEDFVATSMVMTTPSDAGPLGALPTGYEKIILAMTLEERRNPEVFKGTNAQDRIARVAAQAGMEPQVAKTFLSDFGSIQQFFAKVQQGTEGGKGALRQPMQMAAEYIANKPRRMRRSRESQNKMLKEAGKNLRAKKAWVAVCACIQTLKIPSRCRICEAKSRSKGFS